jgi:dynein heavy chain
MLGQIHAKLDEFQMKVKKEDKDAFNESLAAISTLSNIIQTVESAQEGNKELFKKTLNELVPKLDKEINELFEEAQDKQFLDGKSDMFEMLKVLDGIEARFKELETRSTTYNKWQEVLETQPTVFENLDGTREEMSLRCLMWRSLNEWGDMCESWYKQPLNIIDSADIAHKAELYYKRCMRLEKSLDANPIQGKLKDLVETFREAMPIVKAFRNDKLTEVHWGQIKALIQKEFDITQDDFTLKSLIDLDVNQFKEEITTISTQATQEANLRSQINEIDDLYKKTNFDVVWDDKCECFILKDMEAVFTALDDSLANINMILGSRFVKPLRQEAEQWQSWILILSDMVDEWLMCQKNWRYLENIFKAPDIKKSLSEETKKFEGVSKFFLQLMGGP